eukprot:TRINITY_DN3202_c0_g1_i10.p1 TRINITY_DN3202_c0_g1~~TRINITY_DN3202_c0_g1_i10.p1  ORF type:complete len:188 (-),score=54.44 TRINITY_DN3202_c0_g1_i10:152-715(-)
MRTDMTPAEDGNGVRKRRGRKKVQKKLNGAPISENDISENGEEDEKRKQEKIEQRRELMRKHMEEVKWQAVHKILNEKGRKEREKEKKAKKDKEDQKAKEAAIHAKKTASLTNIRTKYYKDGSITLSFPQGFLLPQVLSKKKVNEVASKKTLASNKCVKCGNNGKYRNAKNGTVTCSFECYKAAALN